MLADTPREEKAETLRQTISYVKVKLSVDSPPENLRPAKAKINLHRLGEVKAKTLVDTMAETLKEAKAMRRHVGTHWEHKA